MQKKWIAVPLIALPLAIGGVVYAASQAKQADTAQQSSERGYVCPVTGEALPCPSCCPLNDGK